METLLQGRWALVTGASSGLGSDFARQLAVRQCNLILVARREDRLRALQHELTRIYQVDVAIIPWDLEPADAPQQLYAMVQARGKQVDVLINNAGFGIHGQFVTIPWEREKRMLDLDILALVHLTKLFLPDMLARNFGFILQIASIAAYQPTPTYATYAAAKTFVLHFGEALNYELRHTQVSCTVLAPGVTNTAFFQVAGQQPMLYHRLVMMRSSDVARIGIEAMLRRQTRVVAGRINAVMAWSNRLVPRRLSAALAHRLMTVQ